MTGSTREPWVVRKAQGPLISREPHFFPEHPGAYLVSGPLHILILCQEGLSHTTRFMFTLPSSSFRSQLAGHPHWEVFLDAPESPLLRTPWKHLPRTPWKHLPH